MTAIAAEAAAAIEAWLIQHPETVSIQDVRSDPIHQQNAVDFIWHTNQAVYTIAVSAARWEEAGYFFFETQADEIYGTASNFITTEAQYVFYYFVASKMLYILPMPETSEWFEPRLEIFQDRRTTTPTADGGYYITTGRLVPILAVLAAIPNIEEIRLD